MNGNMYKEIHQHGSYIIVISGPCTVWGFDTVSFWEQLNELFFGNNTKHSWNSRVKFVASVMSNCTHMENKIF